MSSQIRIVNPQTVRAGIYEIAIWEGGLICKHQVCQMLNSQSRKEIWAVRAGICEIAFTDMSDSSSNTWSAKYELSE